MSELRDCKLDKDKKYEDVKCAEINDCLDLILKTFNKFLSMFFDYKRPSPIQINIKKCILLIERNLPGYQEDYSISKNPMKLKGYTKQTCLVNGPVSFYAFVSPDQKKYIYLFGDVHTKRRGCDKSKLFIKLQDLISNTIRIHSDKIIDVFLEKRNFETTSKEEEEEEEKSFMTELKKYFDFYGCGSPYASYSNNCKENYPNARFHSADIRSFYTKNSEYLTEILKSPAPNKIKDEVLKKIKKQIDAVKDMLIRDKLHDVFASVYFDMHYKSDKLSPLMDVYLLSRLFRSYGDHEDKKVDFDNEDVNYAIVYTGNKHTDFYCDFLLSSGYDLLYKVNKLTHYTQCIEIPVLVDNKTGAPFLGFGHDKYLEEKDLEKDSEKSLEKYLKKYLDEDLDDSDDSDEDLEEEESEEEKPSKMRRVKKSKSIPKKPKRGSARVRRVKKSKSIPKKPKRGSARARRVKKSKSITKSKRDRLD